MVTATAWLLNLDADVELENPARYQSSAERELRVRGLFASMGMLVRPQDLVLERDTRERARSLRVLAFCPTAHALARIAELGLPPPAAPAMATLRTANGRAFCAELGQTLEQARYVYDMETLEETIRGPSPTGDFVLKRPFAFAGRERRRAVGGLLDPSTRGFAERSFRTGEGLQVEPWLERAGDFALHGYLGPTGELFEGPLVRQQCDAMGRWQGSHEVSPTALDPAHLRRFEEERARSATALHAIGYFGPFGLDGFEYRGARGGLDFQPRSEINARFSMGYPRALLEHALARLGAGAET
jgi:hypothetical protein